MGFPAFLAAPAFWGPIAASLGSVGLGAVLNNNPRRRGPDLEELRRRAMAYLDPIAMEQEVARQEGYVQNSPMTAALRSQLVQAGQMGATAINQRLAQTGLGHSGVGMALESGVRAAPGIQEAALIGQLMQQARERANQIQQLRAQTVMSGGMMPDDPNYMAQMLGAVIGAGMGPAMEASFGKGKTTPKKAGPSAVPYTPARNPINPTTGLPFSATTSPSESLNAIGMATAQKNYRPTQFAMAHSRVGMPMTNASGWTMPTRPTPSFLGQLSGPQDTFNYMWNRNRERPKNNFGLNRNFWGGIPYAPTQQWGY